MRPHASRTNPGCTQPEAETRGPQIAQEAVEESRSECGGVRKVPLAVAIFSADLLLCGASPRAPVIAYVLLTGRASDSDRPTIARIHCPSNGGTPSRHHHH